MNNEVLFQSSSENWGTPDALFQSIEQTWGPFDLDAAADRTNTKATKWYGYYDDDGCFQDGLIQPWLGLVFCNPPFNRKKKMYVGPWVEKAWKEVSQGIAELVCMLIPVRTDTRWWQDIVMQHADQVFFVRGRVKFVQAGKDNSATFPSAIVIFRRDNHSKPEFATWAPNMVN